MKKLFLNIILLTAILLVSSCNKVDFDNVPVDGLLGKKIEPTISIAELIESFGVGDSLFAIRKIESDKDVVINGIVTSFDKEGNMYKSIVIQEEGKDARAIKISLDVSSLSAIYPLGQRVSVVCNNLYIGNYAQSPQIGIFYKNPKKDRVEPGRIPKLVADNVIKPYGMPEPNAIVPDTMTIAQITAGGEKLYNKLVYIKNTFFTGMGSNYGKPGQLMDGEYIFAPSTNGVGYPQAREIQDGTGSIFISTSEYARFASYPLPYSNIKGDITAIVGWYNDKDKSLKKDKIYHQLILRSINDLGRGFEKYHTAN